MHRRMRRTACQTNAFNDIAAGIHYHPHPLPRACGALRSLSMFSAGRTALVLPFLLAVLLIPSVPAFAQIDFTGVWNGNTNSEDGPERAAGPSLVEFLGLPINDQARQWGLAYRPGRLSLPEHQCQVHIAHYIHRGPFAARIWEERDPVTHQLIAIHEAISTYEQKRTIWMDEIGRAHV